MLIKIFDTECYPNLFSLGAINHVTKERELYVISEKQNDLDKIIDFCKQKGMYSGHNILNYDNLLLAYLITNYEKFKLLDNLSICKSLKLLSNRIIEKQKNQKHDEDIQQLFKVKVFSSCLDTLAITNTVDRTSLKQLSVNLKFHNVQELPYKHDTYLSETEIQDVLDYMFNDVEISDILFEKKKEDILLRTDVSKRYKVNVLNCNDTSIAKKILDKYYSEYTKIPISDFKDLRSFNTSFYLKELMPDIFFEMKEFQNLKLWFENQLFTEAIKIDVEKEVKKSDSHYDVILPNISIRYGYGGVHSIDTPGIFEKSNTHSIMDCDFSSFYPNMIINYKIKPRHVKNEFLTILETLTKERIQDKKEGRKKDADVKKIIINSTYGLMGSEYYWLRDKKALLKTTITGQMILSKFAEKLLLNGFKIISLNTDGVLCIVKNSKMDLYYKICNDISKLFNIDVEFTEYKKYIRKDVNNYLSITTKDEIKQKGKYFSTKIALNKGYYYPVIAKSLNEYYINEIDPLITLKNEKDIYNFMSSQKVNTEKFNAELHYVEDFQIKTKSLQKINRWVVTKKGAKFFKVSKIPDIKTHKIKKIGIEKNNLVTITNKITDKDISNYNIDYKFYENICNDVINQISPQFTQQKLF
jgi:hypothetical protein